MSLSHGSLFVPLAAILGLSAIPGAQAACTQTGNNVVCDGSNTTFGNGTQNGLTVQALATATFTPAAGIPAIWLNNNGTITSAATIINTVANSYGLLAWDRANITNSGAITLGSSGTGLFAGVESTVRNSGRITAGDSSRGIYISNNLGTVSNTGDIILGANSTGIYFSPGFSGHQITNEGRIIAGAGSTGIALMTNDRLTNSGLIQVGPGGAALTAMGSFRDIFGPGFTTVGGDAIVVNSGTIDGRIDLSYSAAHPNIVTNSGTITVTQGPLGQEHFIQGTYTQTSTGRLSLRVTPDSTYGIYDRFVVGGPANLNGTLVLDMQPGAYANSTTYNFLVSNTAAGSTGNFAIAVTTSPYFRATVNPYNAGWRGATITRIRFDEFATTDANGRAVGAALEAGYTPALAAQAGSIYNVLLFSGAAPEYSLLADQSATGVQDSAIWTGSLMSQALQTRATVEGGDEGSTIWARGIGRRRELDSLAGAPAIRGDARGGMAGFDHSPGGRFAFGVAGGVVENDFDMAGASGEIQTVGGGGYASLRQDGVYLTGFLHYGNLEARMQRIGGLASVAENLSSRADGTIASGGLEIGGTVALDAWSLTPFIGFRITQVDLDAYRESAMAGPGISALAFPAWSRTLPESRLGARTTFSGEAFAVPFLVQVGAAWAHDFNPQRYVTAGFAQIANSDFLIRGTSSTGDRAELEGHLRIPLAAGIAMEISGYGQFAGRLTQVGVTAGLDFLL